LTRHAHSVILFAKVLFYRWIFCYQTFNSLGVDRFYSVWFSLVYMFLCLSNILVNCLENNIRCIVIYVEHLNVDLLNCLCLCQSHSELQGFR
jgi:low temperature requirement protein LtrA